MMLINDQKSQGRTPVHSESLIPSQILEARLGGGIISTVDGEQDVALASGERVRILYSIDAEDCQ